MIAQFLKAYYTYCRPGLSPGQLQREQTGATSYVFYQVMCKLC